MAVITRRNVLIGGALAAVPWPKGAVSRPDSSAGPNCRMSLPGTHTPDSVTVSSNVTGATTVSLAYSETADAGGNPTGNVLYVPGEVDTDSLVQHTAAGLRPDTKYYAKLSVNPGSFVGHPIQFRSNPSGGAFSRKWVYGSCQGDARTDPAPWGGGPAVQLAWKDIQAYAPDLGWFTGDYGYWGSKLTTASPYTSHLHRYENQTLGLREMKRSMALCCWDQEADDHEVCAKNCDSYNNVVRDTNMVAMQKFFALHPLADLSPRKRGLYGSYMLSRRIRVVMLDAETLDRSPALLDDTPENGKTFLGTPQDIWLRNLLVQPAVLNILICGKSLLGDAVPPGVKPPPVLRDKPANYGLWRASLCDYVANTPTLDGLPINVVWMGGDRHANGYCSPANNPLGPFPVWLGSGVSWHALQQRAGEVFDFSYGFNDLNIPVMQYLQGVLSDDGLGKITLSGLSREVHDTWNFSSGTMTDPATWVMSDGGSASDTWAYPVPSSARRVSA